MAILNIHKTKGIGVQTSAIQRTRINTNQIIITSTDAVNVRATASTSGTIIGTALQNDIYEVIETSSGWYHIQYTEENDGWIGEEYAEYVVDNVPSLTINETTKVQGFYPVGSLYFSINSTNPTEYFGGTWELYCPGRTIAGVNEDDSNFSTANNNNTKGAKTITLTTSQIPSHSHNWASSTRAASGTNFIRMRAYSYSGADGTGYATSYSGSSEAHNNLQPYITCYIWIRTA